MSPRQHLTLERHHHTAVITLCHPPANTWNRGNLFELRTLLTQLETERDIHALVITGLGNKFFSAGADLSQLATGNKDIAHDIARLFGDAFEALTHFHGVTIAAINGYAMGGGLECALACDIRIAEHHAVMALPEASVGLLPCAGGTQNLPWLVGEGWAKRMILCGEHIDAATALKIGLVEEIVERGGSKQAALALASKVAKQSPASIKACKALIQRARFTPPIHNLIEERNDFVKLFDTEDPKEGVQAFLEKRQPIWKNR